MNCFALAAISLHLASVHTEPGYNNINPGVNLASECGIVAGAYVSSQSTHGKTRWIEYVGYSAETKWRWPVFASIAAAHGYVHERTGKSYGIVPLAMVGIKTPRVGRVRGVLGVIPTPRTAVIHAMLEYDL